MSELYLYLKDFAKHHFRWHFVLTLTILMAVCLGINYQFQFKNTYIKYLSKDNLEVLKAWLFYLFPMVLTFLLYLRLGGGA